MIAAAAPIQEDLEKRHKKPRKILIRGTRTVRASVSGESYLTLPYLALSLSLALLSTFYILHSTFQFLYRPLAPGHARLRDMKGEYGGDEMRCRGE